MDNIKSKIRTIPNFPSKGIMFRDFTTLLMDPDGLKDVIRAMAIHWNNRGVTKIVGIDARGFIVGGALAYEMNIGFVPVRKKESYLLKRSRKNICLNMEKTVLRC